MARLSERCHRPTPAGPAGYVLGRRSVVRFRFRGLWAKESLPQLSFSDNNGSQFESTLENCRGPEYSSSLDNLTRLGSIYCSGQPLLSRAASNHAAQATVGSGLRSVSPLYDLAPATWSKCLWRVAGPFGFVSCPCTSNTGVFVCSLRPWDGTQEGQCLVMRIATTHLPFIARMNGTLPVAQSMLANRTSNVSTRSHRACGRPGHLDGEMSSMLLPFQGVEWPNC